MGRPAVNPSTVDTGSSLPLRTDSSKDPNRFVEVGTVAGAEAERIFLEEGCLTLLPPSSTSTPSFSLQFTSAEAAPLLLSSF